MSESTRGVRRRVLFDRYFLLVVLVVVLLGVAGGYLTYTAHGTTTTMTETRQVASWEASGAYTHSATVVNDTAVYDEGDVLRNRGTYFRQVTPRLDGAFVYTYSATGGGNLTVDATTVLVLQSVSESGDGQPVEYWRLDTELDEREVPALRPGERMRVPFSVNVTDATQRLATVDDQFGSTPGEKQLRIETRVSLTGTRNGERVNTTRSYRLPISVGDSVYTVQDSGPNVTSDTLREQVSVTVTPGPLAAYGGPLLLVLALALGGVVGWARVTDALGVSERERDWLAYRDERNEFDDWITTARVPATERRGVDIEVDSVEGLVDIAIDTDERVLEDSEAGVLFVLGESRTYAYDPPTLADGGPLEGVDAVAGFGDGVPTLDGDDEEGDAGDDSEPAAAVGDEEDGAE